jgi:hypothetical protein
MTTASQRKGSRYELELAKYFNDNTLLTNVGRAPLSGGGNVQMSGGADLLGTPDLFVEAKRVEKLNFLDAMRQAERNISQTNAPEMPIVINRRNQMTTGQSLCMLRLDDFLRLYNTWLNNS